MKDTFFKKDLFFNLLPTMDSPKVVSGALVLAFVVVITFIVSYKNRINDLVETSGASSDMLMRIGPVGGFTMISPEFVYTESGIRTGLQHRQALAENAGMLFDFGTADLHCMWMRDTLIPLSVAFIDDFEDHIGYIVNIEDMQPQTDDLHCAAKPARYALEMNQGWFKHRQTGPGDTVFVMDRNSLFRVIDVWLMVLTGMVLFVLVSNGYHSVKLEKHKRNNQRKS